MIFFFFIFGPDNFNLLKWPCSTKGSKVKAIKIGGVSGKDKFTTGKVYYDGALHSTEWWDWSRIWAINQVLAGIFAGDVENITFKPHGSSQNSRLKWSATCIIYTGGKRGK